MTTLRLGLGRQDFRPLKKRSILLFKLLAVVFAALLFCEFLIYYLVIAQCNWPEVKTGQSHGALRPMLRAMFLADTHLLGEVRGHWLDKLRREWQMERAFQTALWLLQPEVVFILGDVFDEGKWSSSQAWADDVMRFQKIFRHPRDVQLKVVAGNHDIGFHYQMTTYNIKRFEKVFNSEKLFSWKEVKPVAPVPVGWGGSFRRQPPSSCRSDENCSGEDAAPPGERHLPFQERYDVLSQDASQKLLWWLRPRLVLSGHTHSACEVLHAGTTLEVSVPSFSWRNRNNPSFIMGSITATDFSLSKCYLPLESVVLTVYCGAAGLLLVLVLVHHELFTSPFLSGWGLFRKHKAV
ncbi:metallophosphoesterase 1 isoform X7 [Tamandua tetradactyla]|uniref:metallophosphoesterase 1 isoform X7 n=1 Tax=Tamandua tetradactyla TaxID=48850 RepID=UPI004053A2C4